MPNHNYDKFHKEVYEKNEPKFESHGWIQWKGTNVCMDIKCKCGVLSHIDSEFCSFIICPECKQKYAVGSTIKLIPLTEELINLYGGDPYFKEPTPKYRIEIEE